MYRINNKFEIYKIYVQFLHFSMCKEKLKILHYFQMKYKASTCITYQIIASERHDLYN